MFDKILIANRGEIACRVMRTAQRLGVRTVAVYSEADAGAQHVKMADEAYLIGPPPAAQSYLLGDRILEVAKASGAQAIHPGYGFLSENEKFASACEKAGVTFIGPPGTAIRDMGSKSASKNIMEAANVPCTPGYHGEAQDMESLKREAEGVGYPLMLKAVLGGGGKGMRIVETPEELEANIEACQREALASFGDERILIERFIKRSRHIEFQIFADTHGNAVHLFERDCSVQRRHQKVLEEAPAPHFPDELRERMGLAATNAAKAVGYVGAGTVEFMLDTLDNSFYFMEMNTRLQVEHPVSELITGQDLVEWQLRVASGEPLPMTQDELSIGGHALEARIYAESPENGFLPGSGTLVHLQEPQSEAVRVDTGIVEGDEVTIHSDPMISKLIVHADDREGALRQMTEALAQYQVVGVPTNIEFVKTCVEHPGFAAGGIDTSFIEEHADALLPQEGAVSRCPDKAAALGAIAQAFQHMLDAAVDEEPGSASSLSPFSPSMAASGGIEYAMRLHGSTTRRTDFAFGGGDELSVTSETSGSGSGGLSLRVRVNRDDDQATPADVEVTASLVDVTDNGFTLDARIDGAKIRCGASCRRIHLSSGGSF